MQLVIRPATAADEGSVIDLWRACGLVASYNDHLFSVREKV